MNKNLPCVDKFLDHVKETCKENKVKLNITNTKTIMSEGFELTGYFSEEPLELKVAGKYPGWLEILAHEFSHLRQWKTNCKHWKNCFVKGVDVSSVIDEWLSGVDHDPEHVKECIIKLRYLELDCERRAVKLIKKWKLPISIVDYKKKAFLYMHFHNCMIKNRKWVKTGYWMSRDKELMALAYPNLDINFTRTSSKIMKVFEKNSI